jgi:hypothetical protein
MGKLQKSPRLRISHLLHEVLCFFTLPSLQINVSTHPLRRIINLFDMSEGWAFAVNIDLGNLALLKVACHGWARSCDLVSPSTI